VTGPLNWASKAGTGTTKGRPDLRLRDAYPLSWSDYSRPHPEHEFRYLMLPVTKAS
jgi:hypothetical protein